MLVKILQTLGLSSELAQLYQLLVENGPSTPRDLAQASGITRTYIYTLGDELVHLGLASWVEQNKIKHLSPASPQVLNLLLNQKSSETQLAQSALSTILPDLKKRYDTYSSALPIQHTSLENTSLTYKGQTKKLKSSTPYPLTIQNSQLLINHKPIRDLKTKKVVLFLLENLFSTLPN